MNPKYVVSLELAKKMKELGFKQESEYHWHLDENKWGLWCIAEPEKEENYYSAYGVGELGEMLPNYYATRKCTSTMLEDMYQVWDSEIIKPIEEGYAKTANTEANARAKMLVWLKEQNYI